MTDLYTLQEVAERTGFALRTLQRDARAGKFPHVHRGRKRLMTDDQIQELIRLSSKGCQATQHQEETQAREDKIKKLLGKRL